MYLIPKTGKTPPAQLHPSCSDSYTSHPALTTPWLHIYAFLGLCQWTFYSQPGGNLWWRCLYNIVPPSILLALLLLLLFALFFYLIVSLILPTAWFLIFLRQRFPAPTWPIHSISFWQWQAKFEADAFHCFSSVDPQALWTVTDCPPSNSPLLWRQS